MHQPYTFGQMESTSSKCDYGRVIFYLSLQHLQHAFLWYEEPIYCVRVLITTAFLLSDALMVSIAATVDNTDI